MKRTVIVAVAVFVGAACMLLLFREPIRQAAYSRLTRDMFVSADTDSFDPGPRVGSRFPGVNAVYAGRRIRLIEEFAGANGTLFIASRSLDWCPFCMRQMIQLQQHKAEFDAAGIGMVGITYDAPELQRAFIDRHGITIPILSDIDALTFKTLGILNGQYQPGDFQYGIPYPGMIVIDPEGTVAGKLFVEDYRSRVDSVAALELAIEALEDRH